MRRYTIRPDGTPGSIPHDIIVNFNYDILGSKADANLFIADTDYEVAAVKFVPTIAGTDVSAVTADVMKCTGTQAPSAGTTVMSAADSLNLKATINTVVTGTLTTTEASRRITTGDRLAVNFTGTLTAAEGLIQVHLRRLQGYNTTY